MNKKNFFYYLGEYFHALAHMPELLKTLPFRTRTLEEELHESMLRGSLRKVFGRFDLLLLGLGIVIGSGVFVLSGEAIVYYSGSSVIISYTLTGLVALCAAACYSELCLEYPVAGGAFTYIMVTFGEFPAFLTGSNIILQYILGMSVVARGFSQYLAILCGLDASEFTIELTETRCCNIDGQPYVATYVSIDYVAGIVVLIVSLLLAFGVRESTYFTSGTTILKMVVLMFVIIMGFTQADGDNMGTFFTLPANYTAPLGNVIEQFDTNNDPDIEAVGIDGIFQAAAFIFFSFTGFDAVCNAAEEAQNISYIPGAVMMTVFISWFFYFFMSLALVLMVNTIQLAEGTYPLNTSLATNPGAIPAYKAPFTFAFVENGLHWMIYIVAIGALLGIITSLVVGLYTVARLVMVAARDWLLPPPLARISQRTQTPLIAQLVIAIPVIFFSIFGSSSALTRLVTFGALFGMWAVCNALLYRRYYPDVKVRFTRYGTVEATLPKLMSRVPGAKLSEKVRKMLVVGHLLLINAVGILYSIYYYVTLGSNYQHDSAAPYWAIPALTLPVCSMILLCPLEYIPSQWHMPWWLLPWVPSVAIFLICFGLGNLQDPSINNMDGDAQTYRNIAIWFIFLIVFYLLFSLPMSYIKHYKMDVTQGQEQVVEMVYVAGKGWLSATDLAVQASRAISTDTSSSTWGGNSSAFIAKPAGMKKAELLTVQSGVAFSHAS